MTLARNLLDEFDAAKLLRLTPRQVVRLARRGELPAVHLPIPGEVRFDPDDLAAWIEAKKSPPPAGSAAETPKRKKAGQAGGKPKKAGEAARRKVVARYRIFNEVVDTELATIKLCLPEDVRPFYTDDDDDPLIQTRDVAFYRSRQGKWWVLSRNAHGDTFADWTSPEEVCAGFLVCEQEIPEDEPELKKLVDKVLQ